MKLNRYLMPDDDDNPFAGISPNLEPIPDWTDQDIPLSAYEGEYITDMAEEGYYGNEPDLAPAQSHAPVSSSKPTVAPPTFAPKFGSKPVEAQRPAQNPAPNQSVSAPVTSAPKPGFSAPPLFQTNKPIPNRNEAKQVQAPAQAAKSAPSPQPSPSVGTKPVGAKPTFVFNPAGFKPNAGQARPAPRPAVTNHPSPQTHQDDDDEPFETMTQPQFNFARPRG